MAAVQQVKIELKLLSVSEVRFNMASDKIEALKGLKEVQIGFNNQVDPDLENDKISLVFGTGYTFGGEKVMECVYRFTFAVKNLKQFVKMNNDGTTTISNIMPVLLNITLNTMRGIVLVKTAGTELEKYLLPVIDEKTLGMGLSKKK